MTLLERDLVDAELAGVPTDDETAAAFLARLRVAGETGRLPPDVAAWAIQVCTEHLPATARRMARDRHLRAAALLVSGTTWAKARRLEQEILALRGRRPHRPARGIGATVTARVRQALVIDPETPSSMRHLLRIVTGAT